MPIWISASPRNNCIQTPSKQAPARHLERPRVPAGQLRWEGMLLKMKCRSSLWLPFFVSAGSKGNNRAKPRFSLVRFIIDEIKNTYRLSRRDNATRPQRAWRGVVKSRNHVSSESAWRTGRCNTRGAREPTSMRSLTIRSI